MTEVFTLVACYYFLDPRSQSLNGCQLVNPYYLVFSSREECETWRVRGFPDARDQIFRIKYHCAHKSVPATPQSQTDDE